MFPLLVEHRPKAILCSYCGRPFRTRHCNPPGGGAGRPTKDHVIPKTLGGRHWVWACFSCNQDKAALTPWEWTQRWYYTNRHMRNQRGDMRI